MQPKLKLAFIGGLVGALLAACLFSTGLAVGATLPLLQDRDLSDQLFQLPFGERTATDTDIPVITYPSEDLDALFKPYWEAWAIIHEQYVDQPVDDLELMRGSIQGMLDSLGDEHTSYMDPQEYQQATGSLEGYEGIGAWVDTESTFLTIIAPIPGSPAEEAGLLPGDEVVAVDGEDMTGTDASIVIRYVLGPAGTNVHLTIRRPGVSELLEFDIVRARIVIPSVEGEIIEGDLAYLRLMTFAEGTRNDLRDALQSLLDQNPSGLILDLRNNGGGFLDTSIDVVSEFIPEGVVMIERFGDGDEIIMKAKEGGLATEIPLVALINGGSASASEIVAGAIQDTGRGTLVGEASFGKGSVQQWIPLSDDQGAVRVTVARWYTPNERQIHEIGLEPDVEVLITEEDISEDRDPQLEKAIEILRAE
jgi:carboxyl-terminal processing protease